MTETLGLPSERNESAVTVKLPTALHDAICRRALRENGGNVSEFIRETLRQLVASDEGTAR